MSECQECGRTNRIGAFYPDDGSGPLCRGCWRKRTRDPPTNDYVSPDDYERNREAYDHAAARHRQRVLSNAVNRS